MPESVELNGMTINLVESKAAYDAMTKNPNEMYFVEKEYELEFNVITAWNDSTEKFETNIELISGDINGVFEKLLNSDNDYYPKAKFNIMTFYFTDEYIKSVILDCVVEDRSSVGYLYPFNKTCFYMTNEMLSIGNAFFDVKSGYLVRMGIRMYVDDAPDGNRIILRFSAGEFSVGGRSEYVYYYANDKTVTLGYFGD